MPFNDHNAKEVSMEQGDEWYFDEFGEYRSVNENKAEKNDLKAEDTAPKDPGIASDPVKSNLAGDISADEEFNETLKSQYIDDQLNDPSLQRQAEMDYETEHKNLYDRTEDISE